MKYKIILISLKHAIDLIDHKTLQLHSKNCFQEQMYKIFTLLLYTILYKSAYFLRSYIILFLNSFIIFVYNQFEFQYSSYLGYNFLKNYQLKYNLCIIQFCIKTV